MNAPEGAWRLVRRVLPDGTVQAPPTVQGLFNIQNGLEQTLLFRHTPDGKLASLSQLDKVEVTANEFMATPVLVVLDDGNGGPPAYTLGGETKRSPITRRGGRVSYQHPTHPPFVVWEGNTLTATLEGVFVDHWERVT
jgi:hypothetical protein